MIINKILNINLCCDDGPVRFKIFFNEVISKKNLVKIPFKKEFSTINENDYSLINDDFLIKGIFNTNYLQVHFFKKENIEINFNKKITELKILLEV